MKVHYYSKDSLLISNYINILNIQIKLKIYLIAHFEGHFKAIILSYFHFHEDIRCFNIQVIVSSFGIHFEAYL